MTAKKQFMDRFDATLAKARAKYECIGAEQQMKRDCEAVCTHCADGRPREQSLQKGVLHYRHKLGQNAYGLCDATLIRRAFAKQQKETKP